MNEAGSSRAYRTLLRILPPSFRRSHGREMEELFLEALNARRTRGFSGYFVAWGRGVVDVILLAGRLRLRPQPGRRPRPGNGGLVGSFGQDLCFAVRTLRRRPLFATVAVLTLGVAIGASTAMFSVVDGVLLKALPYQEPGRLVEVWQTVPELQGQPGDDGARWDRYRLTYTQYRDLSETTATFVGMAAYRAGTPDVTTLIGIGEPAELRAGVASASLLPLLGVLPARGRWFLPEEEASRAGNDGASVAVISQELWKTRFGGSEEAVGSTSTLDDNSFTIVGVLPSGFQITWISASLAGEDTPGQRDIWLPIGAPGWIAHDQGYSWEVIGRLAPGATLERALAETEVVISAHRHSFGSARVLPRASEERRGLASPLFLLFGATALLLLIACGNIGTLATAEMQGRRAEIATRRALGAKTGRIARLLLTESLLLALLGSGLGVVVAFGGTKAMLILAPPIPRLHEVGVDFRALGFAIFLGLLTALLFGAGPSFFASRAQRAPSLMSSSRTSRVHGRLSRAVIGAEIALTAMLLVAGGLLTQSLHRLLGIDPGFDSSGLVTVEFRLPASRYDRETSPFFFQEALNQLQAIPGIGSVSGVSRLPFPGHTSGMNLQVDGETHSPLFYQVGPEYFETLGVPLLAGRTLDERDGPGAPISIVLNESAARRFWPGRSPVGAQVSLSYPRDPVTVVGIVRDMKRQVLSGGAEPAFFISFAQLPDETVSFVARTQIDPLDAIPLMVQAVTEVDPDLAVRNGTTLSDLVERSAADERYRSLLMNVFGLLATLLAAAGVIGVTARSVSHRTRELGIRMALGARGSGLISATIHANLRVALAGITIGLVGAFLASGVLTPFLFGIEASDLPTYATVALLMVSLSLSASYIPARRITMVNPVDVLKAE